MHAAIDALRHIEHDNAALYRFANEVNKPLVGQCIACPVCFQHNPFDARRVEQMPQRAFCDSGEKVDYRKLADVLAFLPKLQEADTEDIWQEVEDDLKKTTRRKKGANAKKGNLQTLKDLLGGSVVGLSKFLHFVNPSVFPIYDSKIATVLNKHFTSVRTYIEYAKWFEAVGRGFSCKDGACEEDSDWQRMFEATVKSFENEFDCKITLVRAMELFLFLKGRK